MNMQNYAKIRIGKVAELHPEALNSLPSESEDGVFFLVDSFLLMQSEGYIWHWVAHLKYWLKEK